MEEFQELIGNCTSEWTTVNGVNGRMFTSQKNGNSIFLPTAGLRIADMFGSAGSRGCYWSSLNSDRQNRAYYLNFESVKVSAGKNIYRCYGLPVRPVSD